ncbi:flagellar hook-basal body protein [Desulfurispora thermophila]|uniref:flagellar hook-basal body protein n=1 Tax=Desulfurispora thermophila TaxID=265470 RepID=UPI00036DFF2D|nr:flagellar hook-basal body complex protein [Desulfurispora thermophila]
MLGVMRVSSSGLAAQQQAMDVIANNVANVNTVGFKAASASFADALYVPLAAQRLPNRPQSERQMYLGGGALVQAVQHLWTDGAIVETGRNLDVAIAGPGFLAVQAGEGQIAYTRNGSLTLDSQGRLCDSQGRPLLPEITVPVGRQVEIDERGAVWAVDGQGQREQIGQIQLTVFKDPQALENQGENLYLATPAAGEPVELAPGEEGAGNIVPASLEMSNVDLVQQMAGLIEVQRAYQLSARCLKTADELWNMANNLRK